MKLPPVVSPAEWQAERERLLVMEKAATRARDELAAERRKLPMVRIEKNYVLEGPDGDVTLLDLFERRSQLIVYHFMFAPGEEHVCEGCSLFTDNLGHPAPATSMATSAERRQVEQRETSIALVSRAPMVARRAAAIPAVRVVAPTRRVQRLMRARKEPE
jgi:predicted dithiol-disulfide oxidoreductase (DUF899 family)